MPYHEKFSKKSLWALSSWNPTWDVVESAEGEEEDAPEQRGFQDGMDLCLGAIKQLTKREREREREMQKSTKHSLISIR